MKITEVIDVDRSIEQVWELFEDVPSLAGCLPGAELTDDMGDGVFAGKVGVKLGPMTANFEGEAAVTSDATTHTGSVKGKGMDKMGGSVGQVNVTYELVSRNDGGTTVKVDAEVLLSGAAAQFGRTGLIKEMSSRLIGEFVTCIEAKLAAATAEEAAEIKADEVKGFSLLFASVLAGITRFFKRLFGQRPE